MSRFRCEYNIYRYDYDMDNYKIDKMIEHNYLYGNTEEEILEQAKKLYSRYALRSSLLWYFAHNGEELNQKQYLTLIQESDNKIAKVFDDLKYEYSATELFFEKIELISEYKPKIDIEKEIFSEDIKHELLETYSTKILKRMKIKSKK